MPNKKGRQRKKQIKEKSKTETETETENPYFEDIIDVDEDTAKDFEFLVNAPVSEDDHFVFQSEKNWSVDISKYSEYFTLNLKTLSAAIESIPFNENVNIDSKYFTSDQLTNIYNKAERGKENYNKILSSEKSVTNDSENANGKLDSIEDSIEDLDFLLSLQEPVTEPSVIVKPLPTSYNADSKMTAKPGTSVKSIDLEKWLDSVLDD